MKEAQQATPIRPTLPLELPAPGAPPSVIIAHIRLIGAVLASVSYDRAVHMCHICGKEDENEFGKADNPAGRHRYCSEACERIAIRHRQIFGFKPKEKESRNGKESDERRDPEPEPTPEADDAAGEGREGELPHGAGDE